MPSAAEVTRFFSRPDLSSFLENLSEIDRDVAAQIRSSNQIRARMIWDGSWSSLIRSGQQQSLILRNIDLKNLVKVCFFQIHKYCDVIMMS